MTAQFRVRPVHSTEADHLLHLSDAYMHSLYPAESNHLVSPDELRQKAIIFLGGFCDQTCVGCVALMAGHKLSHAEVKRLFVTQDARGHGFARKLMEQLESAAVQQHISCLQLETGIHQPASHALYVSMGYQQIPPFGAYQADPLSMFFEKQLS